MQPERWQKIERIFSQAITIAPVERKGFLARTCGDDADLRDEITSMLTEDADEEFLSEPVFDLGARLLDADGLPREREFGSYQLQKILGRGGMGAVYLARDARLERFVALKVLPASVVENKDAVARFRQEARAASLVSHPNVARVYEFGENGGCWFLAMEYVAGKTPARIAQREIARRSGDLKHRPANRRRARRDAAKRHRPPRYKAGKHYRRRRGRGQSFGFRIGETGHAHGGERRKQVYVGGGKLRPG
jgi:hypothetical protein